MLVVDFGELWNIEQCYIEHVDCPGHTLAVCVAMTGRTVPSFGINDENNNDGNHATFAKFSQSFCKFFEVFASSRTCLDLFRPSRMRLDAFGCARKHSEAFGRFRKFLKIFDMF